MHKESHKDVESRWKITDAEAYYGLKRWGGGHFSIDSQGCMQVHPRGDGRAIRIGDIVQEAIGKGKGLKLPLTIRIQDLLRTRVELLNELFAVAIRDESYPGGTAVCFRSRSTSCVRSLRRSRMRVSLITMGWSAAASRS